MNNDMLTILKYLSLCDFKDTEILTKNHLCTIKVNAYTNIPTSKIEFTLYYNTPLHLELLTEDDVDIFNEIIAAIEGTLTLMESKI